MVARIDVGLYVDPTCDRMTVDIGAGPVEVVLTEGLYLSAAALADHIETRLVAEVHSSMRFRNVGAAFRITGPSPLTVTWTRPTLRDWLGFAGAATGSALEHTGASAPGVFIASLPWREPTPTQASWRRKIMRGPRSLQLQRKLSFRRYHLVTARVLFEERYAWRSVSSLLLRRLPATWWRNTTNATPWSYTNPHGYSTVLLSPRTRELADNWQGLPTLRRFESSLVFEEFTP